MAGCPSAFHRKHGQNIRLLEDATVAHRVKGFEEAVVFTERPIPIGGMFQVKLLDTDAYWDGSINFGFTLVCPDHVSVSSRALDMYRSSEYWILSTSTVYHNGQGRRVDFNLESLRVGQTVSCQVNKTGELHYFVDGKDQGVGWNGLPVDKPLWGIADIFGRATKIRFWATAVRPISQATQIFEEALKTGYINYRSVVSLLTGIAGSGKTSVKELLFNRPPPDVRHSTPLAEAPIRATCCVRVDATGEVWKEISDHGQDQLLASTMTTVALPSATESPSEAIPLQSGPQLHTVVSPDSHSTFIASNPASPEAAATTGSTPPRASCVQTTPTTTLPSLTIEVDEKLVNLIASSDLQGGPPQNVDMIYFLDSGGQPQFQDIQSLFLGVPDVTIFVTNLSHTLDHHPLIGYYENGKPLGKPQPSALSHLEVLQHTVQALNSQAHAQAIVPAQASPLAQASPSVHASPSVQASPSAQASPSSQAAASGPAIVVVGTHRDKEWRNWDFKETRAEKNQKLISLLKPAFGEQLIYYGEDGKEMIFPVNAKNPGPYDHIVAGALKKAVTRKASSIEPQQIPIKWHVLERNMRRMATELERAFLTREECLQLAQGLNLSEEELDVALDHLTRLNLVFYFRDALPGIIFVRTKAFLDKLTELVHHRYQLYNHPDRQSSITGESIKFRDKGLVSVDFLWHFPKHYVREPDIFTPTHLVRLLLHRLVIAEVSAEEYFMPFILSSLPLEDLEKHRVEPSSSAGPLVISFSGGVVPSGLFPALVASLLSSRSSFGLQLYPSSTDPECVNRNIIKFRLPSGTPGSLTLIDSFTHLEAHMDAPLSVSSKFCPDIKGAIFSHLKKACSTLRFHSLSPQASVLCECKLPHGEPSRRPFWHGLRSVLGKQAGEFRHHAEVSMETNTWACILAPGTVYGELQQRHLVWFPTEAPADECPSLQEFQCLKWSNNGRQERMKIMEEVTPKWRELGIALGFSIVELDTIELGCLREPRNCIQRLFGEWTQSKPSYSWNGLIDGLKRSGHDNLATRVTRALSRRSW